MERKEYLQRPLIEDVVYEITDNKVQVQNPCTLFIRVEKQEKIPLAEVEQLFRELKKVAKDTGKIKLKGVTKFLPAIRSLYPSYIEAVEKINKNFSEISEITHRLKSDGLHLGCSDDELLKTATALQNEITRLHYRNTDFSHFIEYYKDLRNTLEGRKWKSPNIISVTIRLI